MKGRLASIAGPLLRHPGSSVRANRRSGGNAALSEFKRRRRRGQRARQLGDRVLERDVLARERVGGRVEVGDQALEVLRVGVQRGRDVSPSCRCSSKDRGAGAEEIVVDDRGVLVGRQPVLDRGVVGRRGGCTIALPYSLSSDLEVVARVALQRAQHLVELHRHRGLAGSGRCSRRDGLGADGVPGLMSTKKLPSRKIRGRIGKRGVAVDRQTGVLDGHR